MIILQEQMQFAISGFCYGVIRIFALLRFYVQKIGS